LRFTLLLPARHEEKVIAQTIRQMARIDYPPELMEVIIVCEVKDRGTIREACEGIRSLSSASSARFTVTTFSDRPVNKPHGLNAALRIATGDVVGVFDAEDDVQLSILRTVNTILLQEPVDVVQGAVQLVNHESTWFSPLNCVEYFLWFNSRLHHDAFAGALPLAGNTLFVRRSKLMAIGGWDDRCLTEDADLGFRLSAMGATLKVFSNPDLATREETPLTVGAFVRQRTRWHQGFLQVLKKGDWLKMHSLKARLLALHTLTQPFTASLASLLWLPAGLMVFLVKVPTPIALATFLPLYALFFNVSTQIVGYRQFTEEFGLRFRLSRAALMVVAFLPYTWLIALASLRAIIRELRGTTGWEKTEHVGSHRAPSPAAGTASGETEYTAGHGGLSAAASMVRDKTGHVGRRGAGSPAARTASEETEHVARDKAPSPADRTARQRAGRAGSRRAPSPAAGTARQEKEHVASHKTPSPAAETARERSQPSPVSMPSRERTGADGVWMGRRGLVQPVEIGLLPDPLVADVGGRQDGEAASPAIASLDAFRGKAGADGVRTGGHGLAQPVDRGQLADAWIVSFVGRQDSEGTRQAVASVHAIPVKAGAAGRRNDDGISPAAASVNALRAKGAPAEHCNDDGPSPAALSVDVLRGKGTAAGRRNGDDPSPAAASVDPLRGKGAPAEHCNDDGPSPAAAGVDALRGKGAAAGQRTGGGISPAAAGVDALRVKGAAAGHRNGDRAPPAVASLHVFPGRVGAGRLWIGRHGLAQPVERGPLPGALVGDIAISRALVRIGLQAAHLARRLLRFWPILVALGVSGFTHAYGMWSFPAYDLDEGSILSQAWAVAHLGKLDPYTYWYDHPPLGWAFLSPFTWFLTKVGFGNSALERGRTVLFGIHLLSVFFLFQVTFFLTRSKLAALAAALIIALSPLAIFQQRMVKLDNVSTFWVLVSLYLALGDRPTLNRIWLSALALAVGGLSKEPGVLFAPAVAYAVSQRVEGQRRMFAVIGWVAIFVLAVSFYPLLAILKGELFPTGTLLGGKSEHVSLLSALLQSGRGDTMGSPAASVLPWIRAWWHADPILITAGISALGVNAVAAVKHRSARLALLFVGPYLLFLVRGGLVRDYWIIPLLPGLALNTVLAATFVLNWLRRQQLRISLAAAPASWQMAHFGGLSFMVIGLLLLLGLSSRNTYVGAFGDLLGQDSTTAYREALAWVRENVGGSSRLVIDSSFWIDLRETKPGVTAGMTSEPFEREYHYWVVDKDPAVREGLFGENWRSADYVVMTPTMLHDITGGAVDFVKEITDHSTLVAEFSSGYYWVRILKVEKDVSASQRAPLVRPFVHLRELRCEDSTLLMATREEQVRLPMDCHQLPQEDVVRGILAQPVSFTVMSAQPWGSLQLETALGRFEFRVGNPSVVPTGGSDGPQRPGS
jgi:4-amino-4-deoxy-L-arabinose transferase-like glycosyltransferase